MSTKPRSKKQAKEADPLKPSVSTGEFWLAMVTKIIGLLTIAGTIPAAQAENIGLAITLGVAGAVTMLAGSAEGFKVIAGRENLKTKVIESKQTPSRRSPTSSPTCPLCSKVIQKGEAHGIGFCVDKGDSHA